MNTTFNQLAIGAIFRALKNDLVVRDGTPHVVENNGLYAKVGHNVSVDLSDKSKDVIFLLDMPVRTAGKSVNIDISLLPSYKLCNKGRV